MEEKKQSKNPVLPIIMVISSVLIVALSGYIYGHDTVKIIGNGIIVLVVALGVMFTVLLESIRGNMRFEDTEHAWSFYLAFFVFLTASAFYPLIPDPGWPFLASFVTLCLFASPSVALSSGTLFLTISFLLSGSTDPMIMVKYLVPGIIGIVLFSAIGEDFKVLVPIVVSLMAQFLILALTGILFVNRTFSWMIFIYPAANILICLVVILIVLKPYSFMLFYGDEDRFMDIIDPEFELLTMLKNTSKPDYDHCVYTAVLCSKIANKTGMDESLLKALGYYHRIGMIRGENNWENAESLMREYEIPENVITYLSEYLNKNKEVKSKETTVLLFADTVISSIRYLFSKDPDAVLNYDKLIDTIFDKKIESGMIDNSDISYNEISIMRKTLIDEKLFYDFMR